MPDCNDHQINEWFFKYRTLGYHIDKQKLSN